MNLVKTLDGFWSKDEQFDWEPIKIALRNHKFSPTTINSFVDTFPEKWKQYSPEFVKHCERTQVYQAYRGAGGPGAGRPLAEVMAWLIAKMKEWGKSGGIFTDIINPERDSRLGVRMRLKQDLMVAGQNNSIVLWLEQYPGGASSAASGAVSMALAAPGPVSPLPDYAIEGELLGAAATALGAAASALGSVRQLLARASIRSNPGPVIPHLGVVAPTAPALLADDGGLIIDDPTGGTAPSNAILLPFGLHLFGAMDATCGLDDNAALRPDLFKFDGLDASQYTPQSVPYYTSSGTGQFNHTIANFSCPTALRFSFAAEVKTFSVTGESKQLYQQELSSSMGLSSSYDGFGMEVNSSFHEKDFTETYAKYASYFETDQAYQVDFFDKSPLSIQKWLSKSALDTFARGNPVEICDTFGTHYMTSATFGGIKRTSAKCNYRDESISTSLAEAVRLSVTAQDEKAKDGGDKKPNGDSDKDKNAPKDGGSASASSSNETVQKLYSKLEISTSTIRGGLPRVDEELWSFSLMENPTVIKQELRPLSELVADPKIAANVLVEINTRLKNSGVVADARVIAVYEALGGAQNDSGSGAHDNIASAPMQSRQGWYSLGFYGMGPKPEVYNWNTVGYQGLLFKDTTPEVSPPMFVKASDVQRRWGMRSHLRCGLFEMIAPGGYQAISGAFLRQEGASVDDFGQARCLHQSLCKEAAWGSRIWIDSGCGSNDDGMAWSVVPKQGDEGRQVMINWPPNNLEAFFFHGISGYDQPTGVVYLPDLGKIKILDNVWLADIKM